MTTGFQQQAPNFGTILKSAPKPQIVGAKLTPAEKAPGPGIEPRTFRLS